MYYDEICSSNHYKNENLVEVVVDLRSDTLTKPTKRMREAMLNAEVGDDVYEEDPTLKELENKAAEMVGVEAAIFVPSGTMGNLIAIMNHCDVRGSEAYCNECSHCLLHEQCGASQIAGVSFQSLRNNSDGTFDICELESKLRKDRLHEPISKLVVLENTLNGLIVPQCWIEELVTFCKEHNLKLHMDGARLWNACVGSGKSAKEIVSGFDSVTFCLSKALGAPVGSLLCGSKEFITKARRIRKVLGGGMRQAGILGAAGLVALEDMIPMLRIDHKRAFHLASAIKEMQSTIFLIDLSTVQTNMVFVQIGCKTVSAVKFAKRLREIHDNNDDDKIIVKCLPLTDSLIRFVLFYEVTDTQLMLAIRKIRYVIKEFDSNI
ncbi:L-allo-threonine aldolase isoform X3 [Ptiloglossa arizonensis]|uniref:L-allo-threonine aldolase isoform X3 n=1 Tax=Ptiloglossa arizonensis TaxID=3350558 RepID=UPI003F9F23D6